MAAGQRDGDGGHGDRGRRGHPGGDGSGPEAPDLGQTRSGVSGDALPAGDSGLASDGGDLPAGQHPQLGKGCDRSQGGQISGGGPAEQQRRQQAAEAGVDLGELGSQRRATAALLEMGIDLGLLTFGQPSAGPGPEAVDRGTTAFGGRLREMGLQVGLAQTLPGPEGEGRDGIGSHPQQHSDLGGRLSFDLHVPQHRLPTFGQPGEGFPDQPLLQIGDDRVVTLDRDVVPFHVIAELQPLVLAGAVVGGVAKCGEQVGAERGVGAFALQHSVQHAGERFGHQVVGLGRRPGELPGERERRTGVPCVQIAEGGTVTRTHTRDQLGVARQLCVVLDGRHVRSPCSGWISGSGWSSGSGWISVCSSARRLRSDHAEKGPGTFGGAVFSLL